MSHARHAFAFLLALAAPSTSAVIPQLLANTRESASAIARECAADRHDEFVERFQQAVVEYLAPAFDEHAAKIGRSQAALEAASADYIACARKAREEGAVPKEACASRFEHVLERQATVRALRSPQAGEQLANKVTPAFAKAMQALQADFPQCDLRKLKLNPKGN